MLANICADTVLAAAINTIATHTIRIMNGIYQLPKSFFICITWEREAHIECIYPDHQWTYVYTLLSISLTILLRVHDGKPFD